MLVLDAIAGRKEPLTLERLENTTKEDLVVGLIESAQKYREIAVRLESMSQQAQQKWNWAATRPSQYLIDLLYGRDLLKKAVVDCSTDAIKVSCGQFQLVAQGMQLPTNIPTH